MAMRLAKLGVKVLRSLAPVHKKRGALARIPRRHPDVSALVGQ